MKLWRKTHLPRLDPPVSSCLIITESFNQMDQPAVSKRDWNMALNWGSTEQTELPGAFQRFCSREELSLSFKTSGNGIAAAVAPHDFELTINGFDHVCGRQGAADKFRAGERLGNTGAFAQSADELLLAQRSQSSSNC